MSVTPDYSNQDVAEQHRNETVQRKREEKKETVELYGKAQELFDSRSRDTFSIERHGVDIEFLYPDPDTKKEFEDRQQTVLQQAQDGANLFELLQEAQVGLEKMEETLSDHAVDTSFQDPEVWREGLGFTEDEIGELYQDFLSLGKGEEKSNQLNQLQTLLSEDS